MLYICYMDKIIIILSATFAVIVLCLIVFNFGKMIGEITGKIKKSGK